MATDLEYTAKVKEISNSTRQGPLVISKHLAGLLQGLLANGVETGMLLNQIKKGLFHGSNLNVTATLLPDIPKVAEMELSSEQAETLESLLGIYGEVSELVQKIFLSLKHKELVDQGMVCGELGDLQFYVTKLSNILGLTSEKIRQTNLEKISSGYSGRLDNTKD